MELGMIGLGKMGGNMARRIIDAGHGVTVYDPFQEAVRSLERHGANGATSVLDLISKLASPRCIWLMVPSGEPTEQAFNDLSQQLSPGDILLDGGNSHYRDSMRRSANLFSKGIHLLDVGTSGGVWGLTEGYCLMVGGPKEAFVHLEPVFQALAPSPDRGYAHMGPSGSGHFVKMVHNGIEYGLMQAYAEGFELMQAKEEFELDLPRIAEVWRHGSVVRSWLLDLTARTLESDHDLDELQPYVEDTGEGRWTVQESIELAVPTPVIALSTQMRFRSRQDRSFGARLLAALRQQFGGHAVKSPD